MLKYNVEMQDPPKTYYDGPVIDRKTAKAQGELRYFTGKPCVNGHIHWRSVTSGTCHSVYLRATGHLRIARHSETSMRTTLSLQMGSEPTRSDILLKNVTIKAQTKLASRLARSQCELIIYQ